MLERLRQRWREADSQPRIDPVLLAELRFVAAQEERREETLLNELLAEALAARRATEAVYELWELLTLREKEVTALICLGCTNPEIAERLVISINTVKTHIRRVLGKFAATSKDELRLILAAWDFSEWKQWRG